MAFFLFASFPNSRNKSRSPTVNAVTYQLTTGLVAAPLTLASPANANRTYIILSNFSEEVNLLYVYAELTTINPAAISTFGVKDQLLYNQGSNILYQKQSTGDGVDWNIVLVQNVAERVLPFQNATLESLGSIYVTSEDVATTVLVGVDEGRG